MVLGKLLVPARPTNLDFSRARVYCACSRCGWSRLNIFALVYYFSLLSPSHCEMARYRLKYCLKGPLSRKKLYLCLFMLLLFPRDVLDEILTKLSQFMSVFLPTLV